jgi:hypothetical protein
MMRFLARDYRGCHDYRDCHDYRGCHDTLGTTAETERDIVSAWVDKQEFDSVLRKAWVGLAKTVAKDGKIHGVCPGTGIGSTDENYESRDPAARGSADGGYWRSGPGLGSWVRAAVSLARYEALFGVEL